MENYEQIKDAAYELIIEASKCSNNHNLLDSRTSLRIAIMMNAVILNIMQEYNAPEDKIRNVKAVDKFLNDLKMFV